jgi:hypothetical protein
MLVILTGCSEIVVFNSSYQNVKVNVMMCRVFIWLRYECLIVICAVAYVYYGGSLTEPVEG